MIQIGKLYTIKEVAKLAGVSTRTIVRRVESGHFPRAYKTGDARNSHWRIPGDEVADYLTMIGRLKE